MVAVDWWKSAVFYSIYTRSFVDGNGDGIGDLAGIASKLDYLADLGVDALWLTPHFPSPLVDGGYDVTDYTDIAPEYGTLADYRHLLDSAHARGMRVLVDLVLNHTSDQHPWFLESKSGRDNARSDWYVWADAPNDWQSVFDGPAWTFAAERGQFYYHFFLPEQPDLNWRNPVLRAAMWAVARFWLDLGVDGFRLDAITILYEDAGRTPQGTGMSIGELRALADTASTPQDHVRVAQGWQTLFRYQACQPEVHARLKELRALADAYPGGRVLLGEEEDPAYLGQGDELHLVFNSALMREHAPLTARRVRDNQRERLAALARVGPDAWPCNTFGNLDGPRAWDAFGDGRHDAARARLAAALLLTLKGTPVLYYGEEIGMRERPLDQPWRWQDTLAIRYRARLVADFGLTPEQAAARAARISRDRCRTPMQWNAGPNAGFAPAGVACWLPVNADHAQGVNVADQFQDPASLLHFYRRLLHLRRATPALREGGYTALEETAETHFAFLRHTAAQTVLVTLNFGERTQRLPLPCPSPAADVARVLFAHAAQVEADGCVLDPFGIAIVEFACPPALSCRAERTRGVDYIHGQHSRSAGAFPPPHGDLHAALRRPAPHARYR